MCIRFHSISESFTLIPKEGKAEISLHILPKEGFINILYILWFLFLIQGQYPNRQAGSVLLLLYCYLRETLTLKTLLISRSCVVHNALTWGSFLLSLQLVEKLPFKALPIMVTEWRTLLGLTLATKCHTLKVTHIIFLIDHWLVSWSRLTTEESVSYYPFMCPERRRFRNILQTAND